MSTLNITLTGAPNSGKSRLAAYLEQVLETAGFEVVVADHNGIGIVETSPEVIRKDLPMAIANIAKHSKIEICTQQASRASMHS